MGPGPGIVPHMGGGMMGSTMMPAPQQKVQISFVGPDGMNLSWDTSGMGSFGESVLICPGRQDFTENGVYRLKLTNIPMRPGTELYPTMEVAPVTAQTAAFLSHSTIPVQFTDEDFDQVRGGNYVTKVVYLPDAAYQEMAMAGIDTLVSTQLAPGQDPTEEAERRGAVIAVIRMGNIALSPEMGVSGQIPGIIQAGYNNQSVPYPMQAPVPVIDQGGAAQPMLPSQYISGVSGPEWGQPNTETQYGLPGAATLPSEPVSRRGRH
jgi:hypothetical protein